MELTLLIHNKPFVFQGHICVHLGTYHLVPNILFLRYNVHPFHTLQKGVVVALLYWKMMLCIDPCILIMNQMNGILRYHIQTEKQGHSYLDCCRSNKPHLEYYLKMLLCNPFQDNRNRESHQADMMFLL